LSGVESDEEGKSSTVDLRRTWHPAVSDLRKWRKIVWQQQRGYGLDKGNPKQSFGELDREEYLGTGGS